MKVRAVGEPVEAVRFDGSNLDELIALCGDRIYIEAKTGDVYLMLRNGFICPIPSGQVVISDGHRGFDIYTEEAFAATFETVP